ncbi:hypothetical protein [Corallococcus llansteffanensis]|uniref:hypothetical protein n=1 Tax=Corallococcus llansteffanensis TaxID=2316731 RepID=UPI001ABF6C0D|nr:hypothetical protein [Corallococcus llansteffanensis]
MRFEALPPPTQREVERLLKVVRHRVLRLLEKRGALPAQGPEDALQAYQAHSLQQRLRWTEVDVRPPARSKRGHDGDASSQGDTGIDLTHHVQGGLAPVVRVR